MGDSPMEDQPEDQLIPTQVTSQAATGNLVPSTDTDLFEDAQPNLRSRSPSLVRNSMDQGLILERTALALPSPTIQAPSATKNILMAPMPPVSPQPNPAETPGEQPTSLRGFKAAARLKTTPAPVNQSPTYDVWGFRESNPLRTGDASPSRRP